MNFDIIANTLKENQILEKYVNYEKETIFKDLKDCSFHIESQDGEFVGGIVTDYIYDTMEIKSIYVKENYRNKGFGSELFQYIENLAKLKGIKRIVVKIYSFQNRSFFLKKGFKELFVMKPCFEKYNKYYLIKEYL